MSYYNNGGGPTTSGGVQVEASVAPGSGVDATQAGAWAVTLLAGSTTAASQAGAWTVSLAGGTTLAATQSGAWVVSLAAAQDVNALPAAAVSGGAVPQAIISLATTNALVVKNAPGNLYGFTLANTNATQWRYVKIFDKATAPVVGTDVPVAVIPIPPVGVTSRDMPVGLSFAHGISIAITANPALSDTTAIAANEIVGTMEYA